MPQSRPLLLFPQPVPDGRKKRKPSSPPRPHTPGFARQGERLGALFQSIEQNLDRDWSRSPPNYDEIAPERLLVFEVVQDVAGVERGLIDLGFPWVSEAEYLIEPDEYFYPAADREKKLPGRLLATVPTQGALEKLLRAWRRFQRGDEYSNGEGRLWTLFGSLKALRRWGAKDRLTSEAERYLKDCLAGSPESPIRLEVELWSYPEDDRRRAASLRVAAAIREGGGHVVGMACDIPGAGYLGLLADVPAAAARAILNLGDVVLLLADDVRFLGPRAQAVAAPPLDESEMAANGEAIIVPLPDAVRPEDVANEADLAVLDGLPIVQHRLLAPFLSIHDPDDLTVEINDRASPEQRCHGTAMASLVLHGDLGQPGEPPRRKLIVQPILVPRQTATGWEEMVPNDALFADVLHRAVRSLIEGRDGAAPVAPELKGVSLSVDDTHRPFLRELSGAARVIDWLSDQYNILFIVSTGNFVEDIEVPARREAVRSGQADIQAALPPPANRRMLSPAEAVNAVTVGALHGDTSVGMPVDEAVVPVDNGALPAPYSRVGLGSAGAIKPDLVVPGGRKVYRLCRFSPDPPTRLKVLSRQDLHSIGQKVAAPGRSGELDSRAFTAGTSNSTALTARAAARILEVLRTLAEDYGPDRLPAEYWPVLTKALLVHGCLWRDEESLWQHFRLDRADPLRKVNAGRDCIVRHIGHGAADFERVIGCTAQRATLLGFGKLEPDKASAFEIPLPVDGWGLRCLRRIVATVAWFSPVFPNRAAYRAARLGIHWDDEPRNLSFSRTGATGGHNHHASSRGTVVHEVWEVDKGYRKVPPTALRLRVQCRDAVGLITRRVPFGLAVSFELATGRAGLPVDGIAVYDQIRTAVKIRPPS